MKRHAPATVRNRGPILDALAPRLPPTGLVLEVASGSGEHALFFAEALPGLEWQPTDFEPEALRSIEAWREEARLPNVRPPLLLDARTPSWPVQSADAVFSANMIHIAPWAATEGLFAGAGRVLSAGARLFTYGPYLVDGRPTTESNAHFDASLRDRDPAWGLRDVGDVARLAAAAGLELIERLDMPAHNFLLVFERTG